MKHFPSPDIGMFGRRLRHARGHRIPVTIVGGGVMTRDRNATVVVDDFGKDEVPLHGECACCTVRAKLQVALRRLLAQRERGWHFSHVMIETTGDLGPILRTFATERALAGEFYVDDAPAVATGEGIHNFVLSEDAALPWNTFSRFISTLTDLRGADVLHAKGLLNVEGCRGPVMVQFLGHLAHRAVELQTWPDDDHTSRVAFTTRGVAASEVRNLFDAVRALSRPSP